MEKAKARYSGADFKNAEALRIFLREKSLPLVSQLTYKTRERYTARAVPLVRVFFDVDYKLNAKGSNYYVNRVRKVAQEYVGKLSFAIASIKDFGYEVRTRARAHSRPAPAFAARNGARGPQRPRASSAAQPGPPPKASACRHASAPRAPLTSSSPLPTRAHPPQSPTPRAQSADYGLKLEEGKRQVGVGLDDGDKRYGMGETEFSADNLKAFVESFLAGSLTPTKVVEPYTPPPAGGEDPDEEGGDVDESGVTVLTPDNFDAVVDPGKNVMLEFYAPWCGHCKMLKPEYAKLGKEFAADDDVVIAKMDADAHKAPKGWEVQGYPTLFFQPKGGKAEPYEGARNAREMAEFIRAHKA